MKCTVDDTIPDISWREKNIKQKYKYKSVQKFNLGVAMFGTL